MSFSGLQIILQFKKGQANQSGFDIFAQDLRAYWKICDDYSG